MSDLTHGRLSSGNSENSELLQKAFVPLIRFHMWILITAEKIESRLAQSVSLKLILILPFNPFLLFEEVSSLQIFRLKFCTYSYLLSLCMWLRPYQPHLPSNHHVIILERVISNRVNPRYNGTGHNGFRI
jgi:hypothetical protein